ncbi:hypothetical protein AWB77_04288 [Caballeronia fortuita]|uniref:Uncharacterized protein n=1 Tax=Caballeronia fortuita TaxID=1777138 RepID=A0A158CM60_9BURK|nr:hypothetical protein AWB77_04288 [Caballeronia fortuita]
MRELSAGAWRLRIRLILGATFIVAGAVLQALNFLHVE